MRSHPDGSTSAERQLPGTKFTAPLYRPPICIATTGADRGKFVVTN